MRDAQQQPMHQFKVDMGDDSMSPLNSSIGKPQKWNKVAVLVLLMGVATIMALTHTGKETNNKTDSRKLFEILNKQMGFDWNAFKKSDRESSTTVSSTSTTKKANTAKAEAKFKGAFKGSLPLFGTGITKGYNGNLTRFKRDVRMSTRLYLNGILRQNIENYYGGNGELMRPVGAKPTSMESVSKDTTASGSSGGVSDFGTNNQETSVDEGDLIKSDGTNGKSNRSWYQHTSYHVFTLILTPVCLRSLLVQFMRLTVTTLSSGMLAQEKGLLTSSFPLYKVPLVAVVVVHHHLVT
jgi:hypothetical protein